MSVWAREDEYAYFLALIFHAWGMALLVGCGAVIALSAISRRGIPGRLRGFLGLAWTGALLVVPSGLVLLLAYPAKALTNPVFAVKFACLGAALLLTQRLLRPAATPARWEAPACLALWLAGVVAGKLLLHTFRVLMVS